jgi:hypothetical protein
MSIDNKEETLETSEAGKSWRGYEMSYGHEFTGRQADEFSCVFTETNNFSVYKLIKLWMIYIDNVSRGAWSPSYFHGDEKYFESEEKDTMNPKDPRSIRYIPNYTDSHVYTKTLDYAASCYVIKTGPDGEDILYWTKYYGIFPVSSGASAFNYDLTTPAGETPRLNIRFRYSFKRDMNPISLIEFNDNSMITNPKSVIYEAAFNPNYGHSSRPYVGAPFIETRYGNPIESENGKLKSISALKLKYRPATAEGKAFEDKLLYRATLANAGSSERTATASTGTNTGNLNVPDNMKLPFSLGQNKGFGGLIT